MPITEQQALEALSIVDALENPEDKAAARQIALGYEDQQTALGAPLFPEFHRKEREENDRLRSRYTDKERHGFDDDLYRDFAETFPTPEERSQYINSQFLAKKFGKSTAEVRAAQPDYRDQYARQTWGAPVATEKEFADRLAADFDFEDDLSKRGQLAALQGAAGWEADSLLDADAGNPIFKGREKQWRDQFKANYTALQAELAPMEATINSFVEGLQVQMGARDGEAKPDETFMSALMDIPKEKRGLFLDAVAARGGEGQIKSLAQGMGERIGRGATDIVRQSNAAATMTKLDQLARHVVANGGVDALPADFGFDPTTYLTGYLGSPEARDRAARVTPPKPGTPEFDALEPEKQAALSRIEDERDFLMLYEQVNDIATGVVDPAQGGNWVESGLLGVSSMVPNLALMAAGPVGAAVNIRGYQGQAMMDYMQANPGADITTASRITQAQGIGQGFLDYIPTKIISGKVPLFSKWLEKATLTKGGLVGRAAVRFTGGAAFQLGQEFGQDVIVPSAVEEIAAVLKADLPGSNWDARLSAFTSDEALSEMIPSIIMLSLIGDGVGSVTDYKNGWELVGDRNLLIGAKLTEAEADSIIEAASTEDAAKTQTLLRDALARVDNEKGGVSRVRDDAAKQALTNILAESDKRIAAIEKGESSGIIPAVGRSKEGWTLRFQDGSTRTYGSHAEADGARWKYAEEKALTELDEFRGAVQTVERQIEAGREVVFSFSPERRTLRDAVQEGEVSRQGALNRAGIAEEIGGQQVKAEPETEIDPEQEYQDTFTASELQALAEDDKLALFEILGSNKTEFADGVQRTTVKLFRGATPLTVIEEKLEGDAALMLANNKRDWLLTRLRRYERASGDKLLPRLDSEVTDGHLKEAFSHLGQSYLVGRSRKSERQDLGFLGASGRKKAAKVFRSGLGSTMEGYRNFFRSVWKRAAKLNKLRREGRLDAELEQELARSVGYGEQAQYESDALKEAEGFKTALEDMGFEAEPEGVTVSEPTDDAPFSVITNADARIAEMFTPLYRNPEQRRKIVQKIQENVAVESQKFAAIARANRPNTDIERERKEIEGALFNEKLDTLSSGEIAALSNGNLLEDNSLQPILSELLNEKTRTTKSGKKVRYWTGSLMSKSEAKRRGYSMGGEWDAVPEGLPPYVWGGSIAPDQAATMFGFDSPEAFFDALAGEIQSRSDRKREVEEANRRVRELEKEARTESRAWAEEQRKLRQTVGTDRATLVAAMRTLDAMISALPVEIRGKIGGFVRLAQFKTPGAMLDELGRRVNRLDTELERWLKKEADKGVKKLFETAKPAKDQAGKARKGKAGADIHDLFDTARQAWKNWTTEKAEGHALGIEAEIAKGEMKPEREAHALLEAELVRLFGGWNEADSIRKLHALETAEEIWREGYHAFKLKKAAETERRNEIREALRADTGSAGEAGARDIAEQQARKASGRAKEFFLSLLNFEQLTAWAFGRESTWAQWFADEQRKAENAKIDAVQSVTEGVENLFREMAGGDRFKGEALQFRMMEESISAAAEKGGTRKLSQLQGVSVMLMYAQEDGRKHMRGRRDESGELVSGWSYGDIFVESVASQMTPEAWKVLGYLQGEYGKEYEPLNAVYRDIYGVNLPKNPNYSPLTVTPQQASGGQTVDPVTGSTASTGSFTPGSLRNRAQTSAEPSFTDAVATFIAHKKQIEHWKAHARFVLDANAILGNREVGNSVEAVHGKEAVKVIRKWLDAIAQGGARDAGAGTAYMKFLGGLTGRAASMALVGRIGTLAVQSTQLAAAAATMPTGAYVSRLGKLLSGNLGWGAAFRSDYIQRRLKQQPVMVQQAMEGLRSGKPNQLKHQVRRIGQLLSGADALFTAGTFAMVHDYQFAQARKNGLDAAEAEAFAMQEAERVLESIAQPTRMGTRSFFEVSTTNPLTRMAWAFASDARKNAALLGYQFSTGSAADKYRATLFVIALNGLMAGVIRNAWRDMRDDEDEDVFDEKYWNVKRLILSSGTDWLFGFPVVGEEIQRALYSAAGVYQPGSGLLSGVADAPGAVERLATGEWENALRDVEKIATAVGYFNDDAAAITSLLHVVRDVFALGENLIPD